MTDSSGESLFPNVVTENLRVRLRVVEAQDLPLLRRTQVEVLGPGWRHRGMTSSPEAFDATVWAGSAVQLLAEGRQTGELIAWLNAYNYEAMDGVVSVAIARLSVQELGTAFGSAVVLFLQYVFRVLSVRKIYFEVAEYNLPRIQSIVGSFVHSEAVLSERLVADSRTWNLHILSVTERQLRAAPNYDALMRQLGDELGAPISREAFLRQLDRILEREVGVPPLTMDTKLVEDLSVDSLELLRIGLMLEEMADALLFFDDVEVPETVGDLYKAYVSLIGHS